MALDSSVSAQPALHSPCAVPRRQLQQHDMLQRLSRPRRDRGSPDYPVIGMFVRGASKHPLPQRQRLDGSPGPSPVVEHGTQGATQLLAGALHRGPRGRRLRVLCWQASKHCPRLEIEETIRGMQVALVDLC